MTDILHSNLETDLRMASKILGSSIRITLADTADIIDSGAVELVGDVAGTGSDTVKVGFADYHSDHAAATVAENTDVSTTALTDDSTDIPVVRHALRRDISDLANLTGQGGNDVGIQRLAEALVTSARMGWMDDLADAIETLTSTVGTTGVDFSVDDWYDAQFTLQLASVPGPYFAKLHPRQLSDLQESLRAEGGATQWQPQTAEMLAIKGQGFAGSFNGVDVYVSSTVDLDTDRKGAMWGRGCFGYAVGTLPMPVAGTAFESVNGWIAVELQRDASAALTECILHSYYGIAAIEDARGVEIATDA